MTHEYDISGMTCSACVYSVKDKLQKVSGVTNVEVIYEVPKAIITMDKHIALGDFQNAFLNSKYAISSASTAGMTMPAEEKKDSYYPIFLIFGYIAGVTVLGQFAKGGFNLMQWMAQFMAGFFIVFSAFKMLRLQAFADGYRTYDIIAKKLPVYGYIYPFFELALGVAYILNLAPLATNIATLALMGVSTIGVVQSLAKKNVVRCACLGTIIDLPLSKVTLFEDLLMVAMSAIMIVMYL